MLGILPCCKDCSPAAKIAARETSNFGVKTECGVLYICLYSYILLSITIESCCGHAARWCREVQRRNAILMDLLNPNLGTEFGGQ